MLERNGKRGGIAPVTGRGLALLVAVVALGISTLALALPAGGSGGLGVDRAEAASCKQVRLGARVLKKGHCGEDVRVLNWFLHANRMKVNLNGAFKNPTRAAVRKFQKGTKLKRDGIVGAQTVKKMRGKMAGGQASWYGPGFWGNRTACGQKLKKKTVGVAVPAEKVKRFPCGTRVLLNHGGRWVRAKVIDTGGFGRYGRKWDLTERTAKLLNKNYKRDGVFKVRSSVRSKKK